jgi:hypothetical protein
MTPFEFFNQFSFFMPWALLLTALSVLFVIKRARRGWWIIGAGVIGLAIAGFVLTTPRPTSIDTGSADSITRGIASAGKPVLVHFHSHY